MRLLLSGGARCCRFVSCIARYKSGTRFVFGGGVREILGLHTAEIREVYDRVFGEGRNE
jgi:hypothetical protein